MNKVLVLVAHPHIDESRANAALLRAVEDLEGVKIMNIYAEPFERSTYLEAYTEADIIIFQFPMYWGSAPSMLKRWSDEIFFSFFESPGYVGKRLMVAVTAGAEKSAFSSTGINLFPVETLLSPYHLQANYCGMGWINPFVVYGVDTPEGGSQIENATKKYREILLDLLHN